jgi:hypothetical protein
MPEHLFREEQRFNHPLIWILLIGIQGMFIYGIIQQVILGKPFGTNPAPDLLLILFAFLPLALIVLFLNMKLITTVEKDMIIIEFVPFTTREIHEDEIEKTSIRTYQPIREYGGWGLRFGRGRAFTASGNKGLQVELKNGEQILIGTQRPEELEQAAINLFLV